MKIKQAFHNKVLKNLGYSKNCCVDWLIVASKRLQFPIMIHRRKWHVLATWVQQTYCHRDEHGFFHWLPRGWWYLLTGNFPIKHAVIVDIIFKQNKGTKFPSKWILACVPEFQRISMSFSTIGRSDFQARRPSLGVPKFCVTYKSIIIKTI